MNSPNKKLILTISRILLFVMTIVLVGNSSIRILAHSGRTDSNGGHWNHSTGEYHYHHGYPPHQHENGECPYDFKNNADKNSTSNNKTKNTTSKSDVATEGNKQSYSNLQEKEKAFFWEDWRNWAGIGFATLLLSPYIIGIFSLIIQSIKSLVLIIIRKK